MKFGLHRISFVVFGVAGDPYGDYLDASREATVCYADRTVGYIGSVPVLALLFATRIASI